MSTRMMSAPTLAAVEMAKMGEASSVVSKVVLGALKEQVDITGAMEATAAVKLVMDLVEQVAVVLGLEVAWVA